MTSCKGRGECITYCECGLYGCMCWQHSCEEANCEVNKCLFDCGHHSGTPGPHWKWYRQCGLYNNHGCPNKCDIVECDNYKFCGQKRSQAELDCYNGLCPECNNYIGKIKFINEKDECSICHVNKNMIMISCENHKACVECWKKWHIESDEVPLPCILCKTISK